MRTDTDFISGHAARRMAQRNVSRDDIEKVMRYGRVLHRAGAEFHFLAARDIPEGLESELECLMGTTVVIEHARVATVYRNSRALRHIRRKRKSRARHSESPAGARASIQF